MLEFGSSFPEQTLSRQSDLLYSLAHLGRRWRRPRLLWGESGRLRDNTLIAGNDAVDGAHSAASKCQRVVA